MKASSPDVAWLGSEAGVTRLATIWATVDLERALRDLGVTLAGLAVPAAADDPHLGARVAFADTVLGRLAIAEPSTEGRLAGTLARHGEGVAGIYVGVALATAEVVRRAAAVGTRVADAAAGPLGPQLLVLGPPHGPHLILVPKAAVPSQP